jgi:hypothetical protein
VNEVVDTVKEGQGFDEGAAVSGARRAISILIGPVGNDYRVRRGRECGFQVVERRTSLRHGSERGSRRWLREDIRADGQQVAM